MVAGRSDRQLLEAFMTRVELVAGHLERGGEISASRAALRLRHAVAIVRSDLGIPVTRPNPTRLVEASRDA